MHYIASCIVGLVLGIYLVGCGSACEDLADRVCRCQPTRVKKDRCRYSVGTAIRNQDISDEREDLCQNILDSGSCTCEAVDAGDLTVCGLAIDSIEMMFQLPQSR